MLVNLCDGVVDCKYSADDEYACDLIQCPGNCECLNYALSCRKQAEIELPSLMPHIKISIINVKTVIKENDSFNNVKFLKVSNTSLNRLCEIIAETSFKVEDLELSYTNLSVIRKTCFANMTITKNLNISNNELLKIRCLEFHKNNSFKMLDISFNYIKRLDRCLFLNLTKLESLHVQGNEVQLLDFMAFRHLTKLKFLNSGDFRICCAAKIIKDDVICLAKPKWPSSCSDLLSLTSMQILNWIISNVTVVFNVISIISCIIFLRRKKKRSYMILVMSINGLDLLYGIYLVLLACVDLSFRGRFVAHEKIWRESILCHSMAALSFFSLIGSCLLLNLLTFSRLMVVKYPITSKFKHVRLPARSALISLIIAALLSLSAIGLLILFQLPLRLSQSSSLCTMCGNPTGSAPLLVINIFLSSMQISSVASITVMYGCLISKVVQSKPGEESKAKHNKDSKMLPKIIAAGITNVLAWVPSSVVYFLSLSLTEYPTSMITWAIVLINPVNPLINPVIFNLASIIHKTFKKLKCIRGDTCGKHEQQFQNKQEQIHEACQTFIAYKPTESKVTSTPIIVITESSQ